MRTPPWPPSVDVRRHSDFHAVPLLDTVGKAIRSGLAFGTAAAAQASVATLVATGLLGLQTRGPIGLVVLIAVMKRAPECVPSAAVSLSSTDHG